MFLYADDPLRVIFQLIIMLGCPVAENADEIMDELFVFDVKMP